MVRSNMGSIGGSRARRIQRFGADWNDVPEEINRIIINKTLSGSGGGGALLASVNKDTRRLVKEAIAERRQAELRELRLDTTRWLLDEANVTSAWWHSCPFRFSPLARIYVTGAPNAARAKLCISAFIDHLGSAASCECADLKNPETIDLVRAIINLKKVAAPIPDGDVANLVKRHAKPAVLSLYGPISLWDTSGVTDMRGAFTLLKTDTSPINVRLWDTSGRKGHERRILWHKRNRTGHRALEHKQGNRHELHVRRILHNGRHRLMGHSARDRHGCHVR